MDQKSTIRVLIATERTADGDRLLNLLRKAGYKVQGELINDIDSLRSHLQQARWDALFLLAESSELNVKQIDNCLNDVAQDLSLLYLASDAHQNSNPPTLTTNWLQCRNASLDNAQSISYCLQLLARELRSLADRRERRRLSIENKELQQRYLLLLENASDAVAYVNDGLHVYANTAYLELFGFDTPAQLKRHSLLDLVDDKDVARVRDYLQSASLQTEPPCIFLGVTAPNSRTRLSLQCAKAKYNDEVIVQVLLRLASGNPNQQERIRKQEGQDLLTNLLNRNAINTLIDLAIANSVYEHRNSAVMLLKLEEFEDFQLVAPRSTINILLADFAKLLQNSMPTDTSIGHLGEGEFVALLSHETEYAQDQFLATLTATLNDWLNERSMKGTQMTFSAGMAIVNELSPSANAVIDRARHNLSTRSSTVSIDPQTLNDPYGTADEMFMRLEQAFQQEDFLLVFQPVVNLKEDGVERYEVRIRLQDNDNLIYPPRFLELANQHGLGERIDRWVCTQALELLKSRNKESLKLTINLTHNSVMSREFLPWLQSQIQEAKVAADQISLQISELDIVSSTGQVKHFCEQMMALGFILSITHYGATASSNTALPMEIASIIKLDRSLLDSIDTDLEQREKLDSTVSSLHAQGLLVIAPMIDKIDLLPYLWKANINFVQGNFIQEPSENMDFSFVQDEELTLDSFH